MVRIARFLGKLTGPPRAPRQRRRSPVAPHWARFGTIRPGHRDLYARVSAYVGWVEGVMLEVGAKKAAELLDDTERR